MFTSNPILLAHLIVFVAFFARAYTGFGGALLALPLLALTYEMDFVVPMEAALEVMLSLFLAPRAWKRVDAEGKRALARLLVGAGIGSLIGVSILSSSANQTLRQWLGALVISATVWAVLLNTGKLARWHPERLPATFGHVAGLAGGLLGGMFGTSGPAYVTYLTYVSTGKEQFRATLILLFAIEYAFRLVLFTWNGMFGMGSLVFALKLFPAMALGSVCGVFASSKTREGPFRWVVHALLLASGLACFLGNA